MSLVSKTARTLGFCQEAQRWCAQYEDFQEAWDQCPDASWLAYILARIGVPYDQVTAVVLTAAGHHVVPDRVWDLVYGEFHWHTKESAHNMVRIFELETGIDLCGPYREVFEWSRVSERLAEVLS